MIGSWDAATLLVATSGESQWALAGGPSNPCGGAAPAPAKPLSAAVRPVVAVSGPFWQCQEAMWQCQGQNTCPVDSVRPGDGILPKPPTLDAAKSTNLLTPSLVAAGGCGCCDFG